MIDPKTLMIGNYLTFLGETVEVVGIHHLKERPEMYWISMKDAIDAKMIHFKPIPLTEQWLLDFGFEKDKNDWFCFDYQAYIPAYVGIEPEIYQISYNLDSRRFSVIEKYEELTSIYMGYKVEFVHQLQNLYLTLTGNHLTLKNKINDKP